MHFSKSAFDNVDIRRQTITNEEAADRGFGWLKLWRISGNLVFGCAVQQVNHVDLVNGGN